MRASESAVSFVQRAGEHAAHDVNDREHAGEKHGGVTGRDRDDVGREPDVGVEHGLQHLERVAAASEMMRDDQRDKADRAGAGCTDAIAKNSLKDQCHDDRAPADENRGGIKIRDRRAFLQIHPRNQTEGVNRKREQQQIKRGAIEGSIPRQPRAAGEQKRQHVKHHAVGERIDMVEQETRTRLRFVAGRLFLRHPTRREIDMLIKAQPRRRRDRRRRSRIHLHDRMNFTRCDRLQSFRRLNANRPAGRTRWRDREDVGHLGHSLVALHQLRHVIELRFVELLAGLALLAPLSRRRQIASRSIPVRSRNSARLPAARCSSIADKGRAHCAD